MNTRSIKSLWASAALLGSAVFLGLVYTGVENARAHATARELFATQGAVQKNLWNEHQIQTSTRENSIELGIPMPPSWISSLDGNYVHRGKTAQGKNFVLTYSFLDGSQIQKSLEIGITTLRATARYSAREGVLMLTDLNGHKVLFPHAIEEFGQKGPFLTSVETGRQFRSESLEPPLTISSMESTSIQNGPPLTAEKP